MEEVDEEPEKPDYLISFALLRPRARRAAASHLHNIGGDSLNYNPA
jgi:hypothetical protein|eukprot:COSAG06_NODE_850_length_11961_cov_34.663126_9_plen_46_part_00